MINIFFAVTMSGSLYKISSKTDGEEPEILKIDLKGKSRVGVGEKLKSAKFVGITRLGIIPYALDVDNIPVQDWEENIFCWASNTSPIVGLFLEEESARECFNSINLERWDVRWQFETEEVLMAIGGDHPVFVVAESVKERLKKLPTN